MLQGVAAVVPMMAALVPMMVALVPVPVVVGQECRLGQGEGSCTGGVAARWLVGGAGCQAWL